MTLILNPWVEIDDIIDFEKTSNVKLHRRVTTNLEEEIYDFVTNNLFNCPKFLNNRSTKLQWSDNVGIMMILKYVSDGNMYYVNLLKN